MVDNPEQTIGYLEGALKYVNDHIGADDINELKKAFERIQEDYDLSQA